MDLLQLKFRILPVAAFGVSDFLREGWGKSKKSGKHTISDAIMDRVVYNSHRIELKGESVMR